MSRESCLRDSYGFPLAGMTDAELRAREESQARAKSQVNAWLKKIRGEDVYNVYKERKKLKELVRRGIPPELRPEIWLILSGAKLRRAGQSGYYRQLCAVERCPVALFEDGSGVKGKFRNQASFKNGDGFAVVERLVGAFLNHNSEIGYVPGFAAVAAFLLVVYGLHREEDVFWVLVSLVEERLFNGVEEQLFFWSKVQEGVVRELAAKKVPKVYRHLEKLGSSVEALTGQWFSSLFVLSLPSETVARVWDCLFCEGPKVLLRVALTLMKKCESAITLTGDVERMSQILTWKLRRTFDANELMMLSFKRLGSMKSSEISAISCQMERQVERKLEERARLFAEAFGHWEVC